MKATSKSIDFDKFIHEKIKIPEIYKEEPNNLGSYVWITQDDRVIPIKEFNDFHLTNTYQMLINTVLFAREKAKHSALTHEMRKVVTLAHYHLHYIGHELYLRQYSDLKRTDKYKIKSKAIES